MTPPKVFIIILQYNNSKDTIFCLESVLKINYPDFRIIVIDNASDGEHLENIRSFIKSQPAVSGRLFLALNMENTGYAGGNNLGIKHALKMGADFIFVLNNDTLVQPDILQKLMPRMEFDEEIGIISPAMKENNLRTYGGKIEWLRTELKHNLKSPPGSFYYFLDRLSYIPGAAILIRKKVFEKVGLMDERYFLYFEDADYSLKIRKAGFKLAIMPNVDVTHKVSATTKKLGSPLILRYHTRNALIFNSLRAPFIYKIMIPIWSLFIIIKQLLKLAFRIKPQESAEILNGVLDFYKDKNGKIQ